MRITADFIIQQLSKVTKIDKGRKSGNLHILCPFHLDRKSPSLSISLGGGKIPIGVFNCFGCPASGSWNDLAEKLGLTTVNKRNREEVFDDVIYKVIPGIEPFSLIEEESLILEKVNESWRGVPKKLLSRLEVKKLWEERLQDWYMYLPVKYANQYYGHIRAKIYKESVGVKYWFNLKRKVFYPYDYILNKNPATVVLVEGVIDMFRLLKNGIPVLATLGTMFNSEVGLECLEGLGVKTVIFCYDGDDAGHNAVFGTKNVTGKATELENAGFKVRVLEPPKGKDPGDMPQSYVKVLQKMVLDTKGSLI